MKKIKIFRCEVDMYRNGKVSRQTPMYERNTKGVYYVGAKSEKEAEKILRDKIRFGSICIPKHTPYVPDITKSISYKAVAKYDIVNETLDII